MTVPVHTPTPPLTENSFLAFAVHRLIWSWGAAGSRLSCFRAPSFFKKKSLPGVGGVATSPSRSLDSFSMLYNNLRIFFFFFFFCLAQMGDCCCCFAALGVTGVLHESRKSSCWQWKCIKRTETGRRARRPFLFQTRKLEATPWAQPKICFFLNEPAL